MEPSNPLPPKRPHRSCIYTIGFGIMIGTICLYLWLVAAFSAVPVWDTFRYVQNVAGYMVLFLFAWHRTRLPLYLAACVLMPIAFGLVSFRVAIWFVVSAQRVALAVFGLRLVAFRYLPSSPSTLKSVFTSIGRWLASPTLRRTTGVVVMLFALVGIGSLLQEKYRIDTADCFAVVAGPATDDEPQDLGDLREKMDQATGLLLTNPEGDELTSIIETYEDVSGRAEQHPSDERWEMLGNIAKTNLGCADLRQHVLSRRLSSANALAAQPPGLTVARLSLGSEWNIDWFAVAPGSSMPCFDPGELEAAGYGRSLNAVLVAVLVGTLPSNVPAVVNSRTENDEKALMVVALTNPVKILQPASSSDLQRTSQCDPVRLTDLTVKGVTVKQLEAIIGPTSR